jgi:hypothetical protein
MKKKESEKTKHYRLFWSPVLKKLVVPFNR